MLKVPTKFLILLSGLIWFGVGASLLYVGLNLFIDSIASMPPLTSFLTSITLDASYAVILMIVVSLTLGTFKGKKILQKSAKRNCKRLIQFGPSAPLHKLYTPPFYVLIGGMMLLGMGMRFLGTPSDIRAIVDVAVGSGLIQGSLISFRFMTNLPN